MTVVLFFSLLKFQESHRRSMTGLCIIDTVFIRNIGLYITDTVCRHNLLGKLLHLRIINVQ